MRDHVKKQLLGLSFLVVLSLLIAASVLQYSGFFSDDDEVTLKTDRIGNQLQTGADVKVRGLIVGKVASVDSAGSGATLTLDIDPEQIGRIPADVTARLLPKTLFGERFVSLQIPETASSRPLADGDVIEQDRSAESVELEVLFDDLMPLLRALNPAKLSATLSAVATALQGRGEQLGKNLADLGPYLAALNEEMPTIQSDIQKLAKVAQVYDGAADDLLDTVSNLSVTAQTLVDQQSALQKTLTLTTTAATTLKDYLADNKERLIGLATNSKPILALLAKYAPVYPCLLSGLVDVEPRLTEIFQKDGQPAMHLTIELVQDRGGYTPGEEPKYVATDLPGVGPNCAYLPNPGFDQQNTAPYVYIPDGSKDVGASGAGPVPAGSPVPDLMDGSGTSLAGSDPELAFVKGIAATAEGTTPGKITDLTGTMLTQLMRGMRVDLS